MKKYTIISLAIVALVVACVSLMSLKTTTSSNNELVKNDNQNVLSAFAMEDANSF